MMYCKKCGVKVSGDRETCPLCDAVLSGTPEEKVFPEAAPMGVNRSFALKAVSFGALCAMIISFIGYLVIGYPFLMWVFSVAVTAGLWVTVCLAISQRRHIFRIITWEFFLISGFSVLLDLATGWYKWSLDYAIPLCCILSMLSMIIISKFLKIPSSEHIIYLALDAIYGVVPLVFIFTNCLNTVIPSAFCVGMSLIQMAALLLFEGTNMKYEIRKKLHF